MTPRQIAIVQQTWPVVAPNPTHAAEVFYRRLFEIEPAVRPLFPEDMNEQRRALMEMLNIVVNGLSMFDEIEPDVEDLGRRHTGYHVEEWHYELVRKALLGMIEEMLGRRHTPEIAEAWGAVYDQISRVMKSAAYAHA
jgi:nitric oxide dioxygenase